MLDVSKCNNQMGFTTVGVPSSGLLQHDPKASLPLCLSITHTCINTLFLYRLGNKERRRERGSVYVSIRSVG